MPSQAPFAPLQILGRLPGSRRDVLAWMSSFFFLHMRSEGASKKTSIQGIASMLAIMRVKSPQRCFKSDALRRVVV